MGGVVSARKAQYFEPRYEGDKKPGARVAPGRTGSDIFPDKKADAAPVAPAAGSSELHTILCKLTAKPGKGAEVYRYFQEKLMPRFQKEPDTLVYACHAQANNPDIIWIYETYTSKAAFEKHGKIYTKKVHAELEELLTGPPEDIVMKPAAIHKGVRTNPRNRSIVGREPLGLFEPKGPHFHKEPVVDKSWNSVPVGQSLPGYFSQPC